jgi:hypothetical protein
MLSVGRSIRVAFAANAIEAAGTAHDRAIFVVFIPARCAKLPGF